MYQLTLKMVRENCGITQKDAAEKVGISVDTLRRWEKDARKAELSKIVRLLAIYKVSFDHVYFGPETEGLEQLGSSVSPLSFSLLNRGHVAYIEKLQSVINDYSMFINQMELTDTYASFKKDRLKGGESVGA